MKSNYDGFRGWLNYIRDYKSNKDNDLINDNQIIRKNKEIEKLKKEIESYKYYENERINLIQLREKRIKELNQKYGELKKELKDAYEKLYEEQMSNAKLQEVIKEKEHQRRQNASVIGAKQGKINRLEKKMDDLKKQHELEILSKNATIEYLKKHRRAPSEEEIKAYDFQFKEVEKRMK